MLPDVPFGPKAVFRFAPTAAMGSVRQCVYGLEALRVSRLRPRGLMSNIPDTGCRYLAKQRRRAWLVSSSQTKKPASIL